MNYCLKGRELLLALKRAEWLPPYDEEGIRTVTNEIEELYNRIKEICGETSATDLPDSTKVTVAFYHQCLNRNKRYLNCYFNHRIIKIRELRWECGAVLPEKAGHDILSAREREYFMAYSKLLNEHNANIELDLNADLEPPKDLLIEIRVLRDCGKIMTENGPVSLDRGTIHFLRRVEVEQLIRDGKVEHVCGDDQC